MNIKTLIKTAITIILLTVIFRFVDFPSLLKILKEINPLYLIPAVAFQFLSTFVSSLRWNIIMKTLDFKESTWFYIKSYFKGTFFNQALPGSIGGDAVRVLELGGLGYRKREAFYGIFIDRIVGLLGLLLLNLAANFTYSDLLPTWLYRLINLTCTGSITGFIVLVMLRKAKFMSKIRFLDLFYDLSKRFRKVYSNIPNISGQLILSVIIHLCSILCIYAIALAIGLEYGLGAYLVIMPPVFLFTLIPISLAGWGVREGAMVGIFLLIGAPKEAVLSISILYGLIVIFHSLPGMIFWVQSKSRI
ncbi:MAG: flippase-like domain-containing protein [Deltaproteobacteria bacterium]|nr:flippase-like domain-containing protein [Deltaproteobacteria bacterium]